MEKECINCVEENNPTEDRYCYHEVEKRFGLKKIYSFDDPEASYSFDEFRIWQRNKDGALFYGRDSGCSCPSPFENFKSKADLNPITHNSWDTFVKDFSAYCGQRTGYENKGTRWVEAHVEGDVVEALRKMLKAVAV